MSYATLISTTALAGHLNQAEWAVFDCRFRLTDPAAGHDAYTRAHIPGALYADLDQHLSGTVTAASGRHPLPQTNDLVQRLGNWGVDENTQVVVYDDAGGAIAARFWWLLRWLGHEKVAVLDGGLDQWLRENRPTSSAPPTPRGRAYRARAATQGVVGSNELAARLATGDCVLVDARDAERFHGEREPIDPVAGHVPGAINIPYTRNLEGNGCFRSPDALQALYRSALTDTPAQRVAAMCGSGVTACHTLLALELAGWRGAQLYVGSWSEWIRDPHRPVATGMEPAD